MVFQLKYFKLEDLETIFLLLFHPKNFYMEHTLFLQYIKMFSLDDITNKHNEEHNLEGPYVLDHPYRMLIIGGSGSEKTNAFLNLIKKQDKDNFIEKINLHVKDINEPKYQLLIKKR